VVRQGVPEGGDGGLVAAAGAGGGEHAADPADQRTLHPEPAGLVEEIAHLRGHVAKARRRAEQDGVIVAQLLRTGGRCGLIELGAGLAGNLLGHGFRHALDAHLDAGHAPRTLGDGLGEAFDIDRKSTRLNSSHVKISYAVFCLKKKKKYRNSNCLITVAYATKRTSPDLTAI